ncbi:OPT oligopeptide transporter protein-domain-containing protein [Bombardia bombarda]|uniref:OPT oligopeptide transporter protein-domain-containing protein n=1 Tax=Bombardia bombarda TaxID=252184 RepID=A0AA39WVI2_9PEZI|nr:OPT oligopeptide transporter protein-domain-containing protein [Bombardia bombarda]
MSQSYGATGTSADQDPSAQSSRGESPDTQLLNSTSPIEKTFSLRAIIAGIAIGTPVSFASIYYGLQAGQTNSMPLPSALLGYAIMKPFAAFMSTPFSPMENVLTMTVAASMGGISMTAGLCGIIPALEYLLTSDDNGPLTFTTLQVILWSLSVCLFGIVIATPFREHFVSRSNLRFPTGTAMAAVISMLHRRPEIMAKIKHQQQQTGNVQDFTQQVAPSPISCDSASDVTTESNHDNLLPDNTRYQPLTRMMRSAPVVLFTLSSLLSLLTSLIPGAQRLPIFGSHLAQNWAWSIDLSPAYAGYGMIMDPLITAHMLLGAVLGWGVLSPLAKYKGWAPGPVEDWDTGSQGWIIWVALGVILGDSLVGICWIVFGLLLNRDRKRMKESQTPISEHVFASDNVSLTSSERASLLLDSDRRIRSINLPDTVKEEGLGWKTIVSWLLGGSLFCFLATWYLFHGLLTSWQIILSILIIAPLGLASIRSMGETDNSLASSLGKVSQFAFTLFIHRSNPNAAVASLLVGGIAEGGSYQASDVMEHLKTGNLVGASPTGLFYGQIIGSVLGAIGSSCIYKLFTSTSTLPNKTFPIPNAQLWLATVHLIYGKGLPIGSLKFALAGFIISAACAMARMVLISNKKSWGCYIPSGIAIGIGIYILPAFTISQAVGGFAHYLATSHFKTGELAVITAAIALVLGNTMINMLFMATLLL